MGSKRAGLATVDLLCPRPWEQVNKEGAWEDPGPLLDFGIPGFFQSALFDGQGLGVGQQVDYILDVPAGYQA